MQFRFAVLTIAVAAVLVVAFIFNGSTHTVDSKLYAELKAELKSMKQAARSEQKRADDHSFRQTVADFKLNLQLASLKSSNSDAAKVAESAQRQVAAALAKDGPTKGGATGLPNLNDGAWIFQTKAQALPSSRTSKISAGQIASTNHHRGQAGYGGQGDGVHLGGFTEVDMEGISPTVWETMVRFFGVKSLVDVGCGRGISTSWFIDHGVKAQCVEGSHDALKKSLLPQPETQMTEHDFTRGPWWPEDTVDAVWCVEFLEHVQRQYIKNYLPVFQKAAIIFASHSRWGGWHHAEVHDDRWWQLKFTAAGLVYSQELTDLIKDKAKEERKRRQKSPNGKLWDARHIIDTMLVFINPKVAALPAHDHIFAELGCYDEVKERSANEWFGTGWNTPCGKDGDKHVARLPAEYLPLPLSKKQDALWERRVFGNTTINPPELEAGSTKQLKHTMSSATVKKSTPEAGSTKQLKYANATTKKATPQTGGTKQLKYASATTKKATPQTGGTTQLKEHI